MYMYLRFPNFHECVQICSLATTCTLRCPIIYFSAPSFPRKYQDAYLVRCIRNRNLEYRVFANVQFGQIIVYV